MRGGAGVASGVGSDFPCEPSSVGSCRAAHSVRRAVHIEALEDTGGSVKTGVTGVGAGGCSGRTMEGQIRKVGPPPVGLEGVGSVSGSETSGLCWCKSR